MKREASMRGALLCIVLAVAFERLSKELKVDKAPG